MEDLAQECLYVKDVAFGGSRVFGSSIYGFGDYDNCVSDTPLPAIIHLRTIQF